MRPAAHLLSFASPKESRQRKGDPKSATLSLRFRADLRHTTCGVRGGTRCVHFVHCAQTTPASQSTQRVHPAVPAPPRKHRAAGAATGARVVLGCPSGHAEKRRGWGGHGQRSMPMHRALTCCGCLSAANAASSAAPPRARASQVASSEAQGHGQWGRLLLPSFLGETRKEGRPAGAKSRPAQASTPPSPSPQPSSQRGEGVRHSFSGGQSNRLSAPDCQAQEASKSIVFTRAA